MQFRFLHTSDWHIGKPFGRFAPEHRGQLGQARLAAIDTLADTAREGGAGHVLVGGDLFDRPSLADREVRAPLEHMRRNGGLVWHVIPGNHDPATAGGIWERAARIGLPSNVRVHLDVTPAEIEPGVWLLPAPLTARAQENDPTASMDTAPTPPDAVRIGLAHGSVQGFGSDRTASIEISPDRPRRAGLAYLALGDWHGTRRIGPACWYSGTPEPDGWLDNDPGNALLVTVEGATAPCTVERRPTGRHRWLDRRLAAHRPTDVAALQAEIDALGAAARRTLLSVTVEGRVSLAGLAALEAGMERLDACVMHLTRDLAHLSIETAGDDLVSLGDGALAEIGRDLAAVAADQHQPGAAAAARALRHLVDLVVAAGGIRKGSPI